MSARRRVSLLDDPSFVSELHEFDSRVVEGTFGREAVALAAVPEADVDAYTVDPDQPACFLVPGRYHRSARPVDPPFTYVVVMMLIGVMAAAVMFHRELLLLF